MKKFWKWKNQTETSPTSRNTRLVKKARFRYQAYIGEVIYDSKRGVDKQKVLNLATCDYVERAEPRGAVGEEHLGCIALLTCLDEGRTNCG